MYENPTANIILNRQKLKAFPLRSGTTRMSAFTTFIQHSIGSFSHSDQTRKINKRHPNWKGGSKTVIICRQHDSVHRKFKVSTTKLLDLISELGKIAGHKVNIQKSKVFLYTNNEISETETRGKSHLL